jgi:hypothetical protein
MYVYSRVSIPLFGCLTSCETFKDFPFPNVSVVRNMEIFQSSNADSEFVSG